MNVWLLVGIATLLLIGGGTLVGSAVHFLVEERWKKKVGIPLAILGFLLGMSWVPVVITFYF